MKEFWKGLSTKVRMTVIICGAITIIAIALALIFTGQLIPVIETGAKVIK